MNKRYLLEEDPCPVCHGLGTAPAAHEKYRLRINLWDDPFFYDEEYDGLRDAFSNAFWVWMNNPGTRIEVVAPDGEIIRTEC